LYLGNKSEKMERARLLILILLFSTGIAYAQEHITTAGFQFKPIFPSSFFSTGPQNFEEQHVSFSMKQQSGFCFGMVIRKGISKNFSFETGINFVNRKYSLETHDSALYQRTDFRIIGYEIPTLLLLFVQLSQKIYMDVGFGQSFDIYPSDVYSSNNEFLSQYGARRNWIASSLLANLGFEYRTEKSGYIYFGASYHRPFQFSYVSEIHYTGNDKTVDPKEKLSGNYLTFDIRYFFHADPEKKKKKIKKS
jgi:hypothetical protein